MAESNTTEISWRGLQVQPVAIASANLTLTTQLLAFLVRRGRLTKAEVVEVFGAAIAAYKHAGQGVTGSPSDWEAQVAAILHLAQNDVVR
jgi:hypothetical protein